MLKHMSTRQQQQQQQQSDDHLRTPPNESRGSNRQPFNPTGATMPPHPSQPQQHLVSGYASPGRFSVAGNKTNQQQQQQQLHVSMLNSSKHSLSPTTSVSPGTAGNQTKTTLTNLDHSRDESLPLNFSSGPLSSSLFITDRSMPNGHHSYLSNR